MTLSLIVVIESYIAFGIADASSDCVAICIDLENPIQQTPVSISAGAVERIAGGYTRPDSELIPA